MKKIYFDLAALQQLEDAPISGGIEATFRMLMGLLEFSSKVAICGGYLSHVKQLPEVEKLLKNGKIEGIPVNSNNDIYHLLRQREYDVFYSGLPYYLDAKRINAKHIYMHIHGLRNLECLGDRNEYMLRKGLKNRIKGIVKYCFPLIRQKAMRKNYKKLIHDGVNYVVPSLHTKYALMTYYPNVQSENIRVVYSPINTLVDIKQDVSARLENIVGVKYVFMPGAGRWVKNPIRAMKAFSIVKKTALGSQLKLVMTGARNLMKTSYYDSNIMIALDYVSERDIQYLYSNAYAVLYPTLNEGFGYPPIEGMRYGKPSIVSAVTSLQEICQDASIYCNPYDCYEIANRILQLLGNEMLYKELAEKSLVRFQLVSKNATQMATELYNEMISGIRQG